METRRNFIKKIAAILGVIAMDRHALGQPVRVKPITLEAKSTVYRAIHGKPDENITKVIDLMGGIEKLVGENDVVLIKPNVQWWNQGAPNLSALKALVELIINRPGGFRGEVAVAENCHRGQEPWKSGGWAGHFEINSDLKSISNMNELSAHLKRQYAERVSTCHWVDIDAGGGRVHDPRDGSGYIYCDGSGGVPLTRFDNGFRGQDHRAVIMSYPVFVTDRGTTVDFRKGVWEKGAYSERPFRFINVSGLNHHSVYCGATSAIKNYLGVTDLSGGPDPLNGGKMTGEYYNFHSFPFNKWAAGPVPGMIGAEIAHFIKTIRKADLNIATAEWIGLSSRIDPPVARTRTVLASTDPVALDYHSAKYVLHANSSLSIHDPDDPKSPVRQYLKECADRGGGLLDERNVKIVSYDFASKALQGDDHLFVAGDTHWGSDPKAIMKYLYLRYSPSLARKLIAHS